MKKIIYEKLVRDKIPEIIEKSGKQCDVEILSDEKYLEMIAETAKIIFIIVYVFARADFRFFCRIAAAMVRNV